jgi:hypothetical protein
MPGSRARALLAAAVAGSAVLAADPPAPRAVGMVEHAGTRLAQIDVAVSGAPDVIAALGTSDFELWLDGKPVEKFVVDDLCEAHAEGTPSSNGAASGAVAPAQRKATATYLFFFDMGHLTQPGREGAIGIARAMLPKVLAGGNRATLVVSSAELKTLVPPTSDVPRLDAALAKMAEDMGTYDTYAALEETRIRRIVDECRAGNVDGAQAMAREYAAEERSRQDRDLLRLKVVLGQLTDADPPKAVVYFADTMRQNPGEHYQAYCGGGDPSGMTDLAAATGVFSLDRVVNMADALGARFFAVEGQGLTPGNPRRLKDSQGTLTTLAVETGGRAFLNGISTSRMTSQVLGDMSCVYLLSFDPRGLPVDRPLAVDVKVLRKGARATVRGRLVIQSDAARLTGRVLAAFQTPDTTSVSRNAGLHVGLTPISFERGKFKARVQVAVDGSRVPDTTWDLGASAISGAAVRQEGSGRIRITAPGVPAVLEQDMEFFPGEYSLVAVAHETQTDTLLSTEVRGSWPHVDAAPATIAAVSVSQRRAGGFFRNGQKETRGPFVMAEDRPLAGNAPTAVITLVCRGKDKKHPLTVTRSLASDADAVVGTTTIDMSHDRCTQVIDLIPARRLSPGAHKLVVTVSSEGRELTRAERALLVAGPS